MPARSAARIDRCSLAASGWTHVVRRSERIQSAAPERFVGIDVPETGDDALIEEHRLQRRAETQAAV